MGTPHLTEIQQDDRVSLARLVAARLKELTDRRQAVQQELVAIGNSAELIRLAGLEQRLAGYDHNKYRTAKKRLANETTVAALRGAADEALDRVERARADRDSRRNVLREALRRQQAAAPAIALLNQADELHAQLTAHRTYAAQLQDAAEQEKVQYRIALQHQEAESKGSPLRRLMNREAIKRWSGLADEHKRRWDQAMSVAYQANAELEQQMYPLTARIHQLLDDAAPIDRAAAQRLADAVAGATNELDLAADAIPRAELAHSNALRLQRNAERDGVSTEADRRLIAQIEEAGLDAVFEQRRVQRLQAAPLLKRRDELAKQHEDLLSELERQQIEAEPEIIGSARLVASTLARVYMNKAVGDGQYDVVLVDEAAAAALPELLLAASKASRTVTFLGDFCQLGPIEPKQPPKDKTLARWLLRDCFQLVGIERPEDAVTQPGCVSLLTTHRFGPAVVELANGIAYGGYLRAPEATTANDTEIVLINTDGLGDMAQIRKPGSAGGRWWSAGTVIAHALAERHRSRGESVGIVTPYQAQRQATRDYLQDAGALGEGIEAGTAHAFQGREFDAVVLDLVEDGLDEGWAAKGSLTSADSWLRSGARLINVGATRARHRLYLVTSWNAVNNAGPGTAMAQIRKMTYERTIKGVHASKMLGIEETEPVDQLDSLTLDIWHAFAGHVTMDALYDERTYFPAALDAIDNATTSVWLWSPWFRERQEQILPHLAAAKDRGVRVTVFVSDAWDSGEKDKDPDKQALSLARLDDLRAAVTQVVRIKLMHQKILVIDEVITFLGSLNMLSHSEKKQPRREIMVQHRGTRYARRVLEHERAERFAKPPSCRHCGAQLELRRSNDPRKGFRWVWACAGHSKERLNVPDDKPAV